MKLSLFVACALLGCVAAVSLSKGALQPRFAEVRNHPADTQDYQDGEDAEEGFEHSLDPTKSELRHTDSKYTPGARCIVFENCKDCGSAGHKDVSDNRICTWVPSDEHADESDNADTATGKQFDGVCVESRNPAAQLGEKLYECDKVHSPEVTDSFIEVSSLTKSAGDDNDDDLSELHVNGNPNNVDIAALGKAEPVYTTAQELGAGEGPESEVAGDWIQNGYTRQEYEGYLSAEKLDAANQDNAAHNDAYVGTGNVFVLGSDGTGFKDATGVGGTGSLGYLTSGTAVSTTA